MSIILKFVGNTLVLYAIVLFAVYVTQRRLLYFPASEMYEPARYGLFDFEEVSLTAKDGTQLSAWYKKAENKQPTVVYFHGNGGNLTYRTERFAAFAAKGYGVLAVSYRGYGKSKGTPTEQGLYQDARAAIAFAQKQGSEILLFGESLGTGVAIQMATEFKDVRGVALEAPYTSMAAVGQEKYWWLPVKLLLKDKYLSIEKIGKIHIPVLILHGELDTIVPTVHGKAIYAAANEPKQLILYPEQYHALPHTLVVDEIDAWLHTQK